MSTHLPDPTNSQARSSRPSTRTFFLINRNFTLLATGQAISYLGDFVYNTTLLIWVFVLTHSAAAVSGVLIAQYAPMLLFGPLAGVFVDRWNRRRTMVIADVSRAIACCLPLLIAGSWRLPAIYISVFLLSSFSRFFTPARSGVLQVIVPEKQQPQAASISQTTFALSFIVGPALASPLYFAVGPVVAILINAVSFLISACTLQTIQASREQLHPYAFIEAGEASSSVGTVLRELFSGFHFVLHTRILLMVTFLVLIGMLGAGALNALDIVFVTRNLHVDAALYGPISAAAGAGTLVGAICAGLLAKRIPSNRMLTGSVLLAGLGIIIYSFQTAYLPALVLNFILCIPQGGIDVGFGPLVLSVTPKTMMGRVQSVIETAMFGISLLSIGLAGYAGQLVPINIIFTVSGIMIVVAGIFGLFSLSQPVPVESSPQLAAEPEEMSLPLLLEPVEVSVGESVEISRE